MRAVWEPACGSSIERLGQLQRPDFAGINVPDVYACGVGIGDILAIERYHGCSDGRLGRVRRDLLLGRKRRCPVRKSPRHNRTVDQQCERACRRQNPSKNIRWSRVLAAACALALLIYGAVVTWRLANRATPLATEQQITANPPQAPITAAVVSLDGKYVAYADTTGVYIRHIDTGEVRPLQLPKAFDAAPTGWFPDGTHLLLTSAGAAQGKPSLWKVSILGGSPQQLMENASEAAISPDGSKIAFLRGDAVGSLEIWVMGTDGSNLHRVADATAPGASIPLGYGTGSQPLTGVHLSGVAWSPDGRQLAYLRRVKEEARSTLLDLETVDLDGGRPKVLRNSTQLLPVLCWAVDGRRFMLIGTV